MHLITPPILTAIAVIAMGAWWLVTIFLGINRAYYQAVHGLPFDWRDYWREAGYMVYCTVWSVVGVVGRWWVFWHYGT